MVIDASAIFVETTIFLLLPDTGLNTSICFSRLNPAKRGRITVSLLDSPELPASSINL